MYLLLLRRSRLELLRRLHLSRWRHHLPLLCILRLLLLLLLLRLLLRLRRHLRVLLRHALLLWRSLLIRHALLWRRRLCHPALLRRHYLLLLLRRRHSHRRRRGPTLHSRWTLWLLHAWRSERHLWLWRLLLGRLTDGRSQSTLLRRDLLSWRPRETSARRRWRNISAALVPHELCRRAVDLRRSGRCVREG